MKVLFLMIQLAFSLAIGAAQRTGKVAYYNPIKGGGSMLCNARDGYGEPLNVIISGESSSDVLTDKGIVSYARAIGFSEECFGIHLGNLFSANLGDGNGWVNQTFELRQDYGNLEIGVVAGAFLGFRSVYRQNGTLADSGALFLAISQEEPAAQNHNIVPDGYDIGRNKLVNNAMGVTSHGGVFYSTQAHNVSDMLSPGSEGINHVMAQDGIVTLLIVTIVNA